MLVPAARTSLGLALDTSVDDVYRICMNSATETWQETIAEAARNDLTEHGAIVVRLSAHSEPEVASRFYRKADYGKSTSYRPSDYYRQVAWTRATAMRNQDMASNFYVVTRHEDCIVVWNGQHNMLCEVDV